MNQTQSNRHIVISIKTYLVFTFKFVVQDYIDNGGSLIVLLGEGGENEFNTNINFLLEEYGMAFNNGEFV